MCNVGGDGGRSDVYWNHLVFILAVELFFKRGLVSFTHWFQASLHERHSINTLASTLASEHFQTAFGHRQEVPPIVWQKLTTGSFLHTNMHTCVCVCELPAYWINVEFNQQDWLRSCHCHDLCKTQERFGKNAGVWTRRVEISEEEISGSTACVAIYWPASGLKRRPFELWVLRGRVFDFYVRSTPLQGIDTEVASIYVEVDTASIDL